MLKPEPRREDLVAPDVLADADIDPDGVSGEGELAEAPVHVAAARAVPQRGLLAVVIDHEVSRRVALRDRDGVGVVALYLCRVFGIHDEARVLAHRRRDDPGARREVRVRDRVVSL